MKKTKRGSETTIREVFLRNIGASNIEQVNNWFKKSYNGLYMIKFLLDAVNLAKQFINKKVTIVGDYDADGITSTAILFLALKWSGFKHISYIIPTRSAGFGINNAIIEQIDSGLIITCDNGIAGIEPIKKAKEKGLTVIILDHHEPIMENENIVLPEADIIIDPKVPGCCDFTGYCGAGLSYRFAAELLGEKKGLIQKLQTFAAIGTVCDVMELREENYVIVKNGMKRMEDPRFCTTGLYALLSAYNLKKNITAHDIGFKPGPALNAASRVLDDARISVELLIYDGPYPNAVQMAENLMKINDARKDLKVDGQKAVEDIISENCIYGEVPMIVYVPNIKEGIIGILAGNIAEKYKVPAIVFTDAEKEGEIKASGRSYGDWNMYENLCKVSELMVKFGGHTGAAGMTIKKENFEIFKETLIERADTFKNEDATEIFYDLIIKEKDIPATIEELLKYEPYGEGNPMPVFLVEDFTVLPRYGSFKHIIGQNQNIVKMYSKHATAVGFDLADAFKNIEEPKKMRLVGTLSDNYFNGNIDHQIEFSDFEIQDVSYLKTEMANMLGQMAQAKGLSR